ncbi:MAG TPA: methyltransferase domain-containing protein [Candidatus Acidoferrum sp.]|nr:methyltransferase domain-containing protein [Candidatus Acidoferrum sp.]
MLSEHYTGSFYEQLRTGAKRSAEIIVPLVLNLVPARSVVDVGCGDGSWLAAFRKFGVDEILGIDGEYVDPVLLQIPRDCFQAVNLTRSFGLGRIFDMAISLEVAEHLPSDSAPVFVECLTRLAPVILFSAAIPFQGGTDHVNEQWQDKWAALFRGHRYLAVDCIRKRVWANEAVEWWYAQNTLLFVQAGLLENNGALKAEFEKTNPDQLCLVHPRQYMQVLATSRQSTFEPGVKAAARHLLTCLRDGVGRRLHATPNEEAPPRAGGDPADLPTRR